MRASSYDIHQGNGDGVSRSYGQSYNHGRLKGPYGANNHGHVGSLDSLSENNLNASGTLSTMVPARRVCSYGFVPDPQHHLEQPKLQCNSEILTCARRPTAEISQ